MAAAAAARRRLGAVPPAVAAARPERAAGCGCGGWPALRLRLLARPGGCGAACGARRLGRLRRLGPALRGSARRPARRLACGCGAPALACGGWRLTAWLLPRLARRGLAVLGRWRAAAGVTAPFSSGGGRAGWRGAECRRGLLALRSVGGVPWARGWRASLRARARRGASPGAVAAWRSVGMSATAVLATGSVGRRRVWPGALALARPRPFGRRAGAALPASSGGRVGRAARPAASALPWRLDGAVGVRAAAATGATGAAAILSRRDLQSRRAPPAASARRPSAGTTVAKRWFISAGCCWFGDDRLAPLRALPAISMTCVLDLRAER